MTDHFEFDRIKEISRVFPRSPRQLNKPFFSDAEVVKISEDRYLVANTDTVDEEISLGIFRNYQTLGWLLITGSTSDLAATGIAPEYHLLSHQGISETQLHQLNLGIKEACSHYQTYILGGDTSQSTIPKLVCSTFGFCTTEPTVSRVGLKPGQLLCATGSMGWGNAVALASILKIPHHEKIEKEYRPKAKVAQGKIIAQYSRTSIDTSDGFFSAIDVLCLLNNVGIELGALPIHPVAKAIASQLNVPENLFTLAVNGEFELVFGLDEKHYKSLKNRIPEIVVLGKVTEGSGIRYQNADLPFEKIRNLFHQIADINDYVKQLISFCKASQLP